MPTESKSHLFVKWLTIAAAFAAMCLVVIRAHVQNITFDEADTYLTFVQPSWQSHFWANANNHVLNSLLMRIFTVAFGVSNLTIRLPALIGAALYISACFVLSKLI